MRRKYQVNVVLLGSVNSGKTALCKYLIRNSFSNVYIPTTQNRMYRTRVRGSTTIYWDIPTYEHIDGNTRSFINVCDCILFCFDSNRLRSWEETEKIYLECKSRNLFKNKLVIFVSTRNDLGWQRYNKVGEEFTCNENIPFIHSSSYKQYGKQEIENYIFQNFFQGLETVNECKEKEVENTWKCVIL